MSILSKDDYELTLKELKCQLVQVELQEIALEGSINNFEELIETLWPKTGNGIAGNKKS